MPDYTFSTGFAVVRSPSGIIKYRTYYEPGTYRIPNNHTVEEFETWDDVLALDFPPALELSLSSKSITADGADSVDVTLSVAAERTTDWGTATLSVAGDSFTVDVSDGSATETIQTTTSDASIAIEATHPDLNSATATLTVQQP